MVVRQKYRQEMGDLMFEIEKMPISEVVNCIVTLNDGLRKFWTKADGWAPIEGII